MRRPPRKSNNAERSDRISRRTSRIATEITVGLIGVLLVLGIVFREEITVESIVSFAPSDPWLASLVFMGLYALKSLTTFVYVKLLYMAAGIAFPLPLAILVNIAGTVAELSLPYFLGRAGGRNTAERIVKTRPKLGRLAALRQRSNFWFCVFVRAVGLFPLDPVSLYFGACGMPYLDFLLGSLVGTLPILVVTTVVGTAANDPGSPGFLISSVLFVALQAGAAVAFYIWIRKNNAAIRAAEQEAATRESSQ